MGDLHVRAESDWYLDLGALNHRLAEEHEPGQNCPRCEAYSCFCGHLGPLGEGHTHYQTKEK